MKAHFRFRWLSPFTYAGLLLVLVSSVAGAEPPQPGERGTPKDEPRATQRTVQGPPPSSPSETPTDPGAPLPANPLVSEFVLRLRRQKETAPAVQPPSQFNPDPGGRARDGNSKGDPYFKTAAANSSRLDDADAPLPPGLELPRRNLDQPQIVWETPAGLLEIDEPLPPGLRLPREGVRENRALRSAWRASTPNPSAQSRSDPPNTVPATDRWRETGFVSWQRYTAGDANEMPYANPRPERWHYYRQSVLKGDLPVHGQDFFLNLTASGEVTIEDRTLTLPKRSALSGPGNFGSYAQSRIQLRLARLALQADFFRGETVFKPVDWLVRLRPVFSFNHSPARGSALVSLQSPNSGVDPPFPAGAGTLIDPAHFTYAPRSARNQSRVFLQEAFVEKHLRDLSPNYDFVSLRVGSQTFNSDFRGFVFNDTNWGARVFGNYDSNRWQYNLALFDLREKDPFADLNTFVRRGQVVAIANLYRQDFWKKGYTAQFSLHASFDQASTHANPDGINIRPAPLGTVRPHQINSYYFGWSGDGHLDRWNLSHAAYLVVGHDDFNGLAGRPVDIFAQMAAVELSYDRDWIRFKASAFYASGDHHAHDSRATGFDAIVDNANFAGGPFSYYARQGISLGHTAVGLKPRLSLLPDLRTSKTAGQQSFVNPGLALVGGGVDADLTPKLRLQAAANLLRFVSTDPLEAALSTRQIDPAIGLDLSLGLQWRPLLTNNLVVSAGYGVLLPGQGYRDIFSHAQGNATDSSATSGDDAVGDSLHSAIFSVALTY